MKIEVLNITLPTTQVTSSQAAEPTNTTLNSDTSFADMLNNARGASIKEKSSAVNKDLKVEDDTKADQFNEIDEESLTKIKSILTTQGFTQSEIDSIKDLKDLKKLLVSKTEDGTLKTGEDLTNLLGMIGGILGGKVQENFNDVKNILDSVTPEINTAITNFVSTSPVAEAMQTFQDETDKILSSKKTEIEALKPQELELVKAALTNEVNNVVKDPASELSGKIQNEITSILDKYKSEQSLNAINQVRPDINLNAVVAQGDTNISILLGSVIPEIKTAVNKVVNSGSTTDALQSLQVEIDDILSTNKQAIENLNPKDLKSFKEGIINEVKNVVNDPDSDILFKVQNEVTSILDKYKSQSSLSKPDDSILSKLVEPDTSSSSSGIDKVTNFMTQFTNTVAPSNTVVPEKPVININTVDTDIVKSLSFMQQGDIKNLTVTITPKELGTVIINLIMQNGTMVASITAANKEAYKLINANLPDISSKLQTLNMPVTDVSLSIYNQDTTFFKDGSRWQEQQQQKQNNQNTNKNTTGNMDEVEAIIDQTLSNSNVNILA